MLYLRGREVIAQRERAADMKRRNGALIYNILPPHVAAYFLSHARHYDDLYSQSYAEVGVLFASMPNFADFYSEESINNQGLECLRFLNEVISDFDAVSFSLLILFLSSFSIIFDKQIIRSMTINWQQICSDYYRSDVISHLY